MKKLVLVRFSCLLLISLVFLSVSSNSVGTQDGYVPQEKYVPNEVLVRFKEDINKYSIQGAIDSVQGKIITYLG
jgi:YbbR domain-containing protein